MKYLYKENWWETKDHKKIKISDMEISHIENTIRYLQKHPNFYDTFIHDIFDGDVYDYEDNSYLVDKKIEELKEKEKENE